MPRGTNQFKSIMKQPDIKFSGSNEHLHQIANHWNIAKHNALSAQKAYWNLKDKMSGEWLREYGSLLDILYSYVRNTEVGIHNLGQELTKIERYDYDYSTTEHDFAGQVGYGVFSPRPKKSIIVEL